MGEALRIIRERDGWKGLRRGMLPRVMTVAPSTAISWMSYEFFSESFSFSLCLGLCYGDRIVSTEMVVVCAAEGGVRVEMEQMWSSRRGGG
jgi:hypothetical protein